MFQHTQCMGEGFVPQECPIRFEYFQMVFSVFIYGIAFKVEKLKAICGFTTNDTLRYHINT